MPVSGIAEMVVQAWGSGSYSCGPIDAKRVHEANFLKLDITKANDLLGWHPVNSVDDAIELTVAWYLARSKNSDGLQSMTIKQIRKYSEKAVSLGIDWATVKDET